MTSLGARIEASLAALATLYPGPGGAAAVVKDGEVLARHTWGFANLERKIPFTPKTLFRMCSITKQFTCALVKQAYADLSSLDGDVASRLPLLCQPPPRASHLCHNQSGLRDYWALAMLHGAGAEDPFGDTEAWELISAARSLQFRPGERYSYVNQNFRILSDVLEQRSDQSFAELLRLRIFDRVGMQTAFLAADTRALPDGTEGYEGDRSTGFRPAKNQILWTGDAGLGASLEDMIAWERYIDASRNDDDGLYNLISEPTFFADGSPAFYGFGLSRSTEWGHGVTSHGGALRGWRSHRLHLAGERLSIVVMFNHLSDASEAATRLLQSALGLEPPEPGVPDPAEPTWFGPYLDPETGLLARVERLDPARVRLRFGHSAETLTLAGEAEAKSAGAILSHGAEGLLMQRPREHQATLLQPCGQGPAVSVAGRYHCQELGADLTLAREGGALYGCFSGRLGSGRMELLEIIAQTVFTLPCPRALDHTPPGDFTLRALLNETGAVSGFEVGCWLARGLRYDRVD